MVSSVKMGLRKTGIDVTTPVGAARERGPGMSWALAGAAARGTGGGTDDSLDVEFLE